METPSPSFPALRPFTYLPYPPLMYTLQRAGLLLQLPYNLFLLPLILLLLLW